MRTIVFGAGYWGKNYLRELAGNLVAVIEPDKDRADYAAKTYNIQTYPELPVDLNFDAAVIATPPDSHVRLAEPLLKTGKYVLVEKPVALSVEEAMRLYPYRKRCMTGHLYMYHPVVYDWMVKWLKENPINHAWSRRTNHGPVRSWGDAMWDLASHDISVFNFLFGQPIQVAATGARDWAMLRLDYVGGISAAAYVSWVGAPKCRSIELVPISPMALSEVGTDQRFVFDDVRTVLEVTPLRRLLDAFLSGSWERATLEEGIEVVKVLEQASQYIDRIDS